MEYPDGWKLTDGPTLVAAIQAGEQVEVRRGRADIDVPGADARATGLQWFPAWEGQYSEVAVHLDGAGFIFGGPGAEQVLWREVR